MVRSVRIAERENVWHFHSIVKNCFHGKSKAFQLVAPPWAGTTNSDCKDRFLVGMVRSVRIAERENVWHFHSIVKNCFHGKSKAFQLVARPLAGTTNSDCKDRFLVGMVRSVRIADRENVWHFHSIVKNCFHGKSKAFQLVARPLAGTTNSDCKDRFLVGMVRSVRIADRENVWHFHSIVKNCFHGKSKAFQLVAPPLAGTTNSDCKDRFLVGMVRSVRIADRENVWHFHSIVKNYFHGKSKAFQLVARPLAGTTNSDCKDRFLVGMVRSVRIADRENVWHFHSIVKNCFHGKSKAFQLVAPPWAGTTNSDCKDRFLVGMVRSVRIAERENVWHFHSIVKNCFHGKSKAFQLVARPLAGTTNSDCKDRFLVGMVRSVRIAERENGWHFHSIVKNCFHGKSKAFQLVAPPWAGTTNSDCKDRFLVGMVRSVRIAERENV